MTWPTTSSTSSPTARTPGTRSRWCMAPRACPPTSSSRWRGSSICRRPRSRPLGRTAAPTTSGSSLAAEIPFADIPRSARPWVLRQHGALLTGDVCSTAASDPCRSVAAEACRAGGTPRHVQPRADAAALAESLGLPAATQLGWPTRQLRPRLAVVLARPGAVVRSRWPGGLVATDGGPDPVGGWWGRGRTSPTRYAAAPSQCMHACLPEKQIVEDAATAPRQPPRPVLVSASIAAADGIPPLHASPGRRDRQPVEAGGSCRGARRARGRRPRRRRVVRVARGISYDPGSRAAHRPSTMTQCSGWWRWQACWGCPPQVR
jgi:hypothetical protein